MNYFVIFLLDKQINTDLFFPLPSCHFNVFLKVSFRGLYHYIFCDGCTRFYCYDCSKEPTGGLPTVAHLIIHLKMTTHKYLKQTAVFQNLVVLRKLPSSEFFFDYKSRYCFIIIYMTQLNVLLGFSNFEF